MPADAAAFTARLRRQKLDIPNGPAGALVLGDGPGLPALLIHGFAGDLTTWQFALSALSHGRRVAAIDLPGHGVSTLDTGGGRVAGFAPWLVDVMDALAMPRAHVVGHSMGGWVALELARRTPDRVASLSLMAPAAVGPDFDLALLRRMIAVRTLDEAEACVARLFHRPTAFVPIMARGLLARLTVPGFRAPLEEILETSFAQAPPAARWEEVRARMQVIWGAQDTIIPLPPTRCRPALAPLHQIEEAGHLPHIEAASRVNALLTRFFADNEGT